VHLNVIFHLRHVNYFWWFSLICGKKLADFLKKHCDDYIFWIIVVFWVKIANFFLPFLSHNIDHGKFTFVRK
jgi:hypothetical protein